MARRRDKGRNRGTIRLLLLMVTLGIMIATGSAQMLWLGATRIVTGSGPDCVPLRAISGDMLRIHCHDTGFEKARIIGVSVPDFMVPLCREEWISGIKAWWFLQTALLKARTVRMRFQDDEDDTVRDVHLFLDGDSARRMLIRNGHAVTRQDHDNGWCPGWPEGERPEGIEAPPLPQL